MRLPSWRTSRMPRPRARLRALAPATAALLAARGLPSPPPSVPPPSEPPGPSGLEAAEEAFIVGDLHGDIQCAEAWVRRSGLVDLDVVPWQWIGEARQTMVFMGDYVDKGPHGRQVLEFVRNLTEAFPDNTLAMLGNHDLYLLLDAVLKDGAAPLMGMPVKGFSYAFTHPEEYLNWLPGAQRAANDTAVVLRALFAGLQNVYGRRAYNRVTLGPGPRELFAVAPPFTEAPDLAALARGRLREWQDHMATGLRESGLAAWLAARPAVAVVGGALLAHAGLPRPLLEAMAARVAPRAPSARRARGEAPAVGAAGGDGGLATALRAATTMRVAGAALRHGGLSDVGRLLPSPGDVELLHEAVTYRGLHKSCQEVRSVLELFGSELLVVGHTPGEKVRISCGGRFVAADSSLSRYFRAYGNMYCPSEASAPRLAGSGCEAVVAARCAGEAAHLERRPVARSGARPGARAGARWRASPVALGGDGPAAVAAAGPGESAAGSAGGAGEVVGAPGPRPSRAAAALAVLALLLLLRRAAGGGDRRPGRGAKAE